ncbi:MAG: hypothetical protein Q9180_007554, partial [Flavoplaca navasiana]
MSDMPPGNPQYWTASQTLRMYERVFRNVFQGGMRMVLYPQSNSALDNAAAFYGDHTLAMRSEDEVLEITRLMRSEMSQPIATDE